MDGQICHFGSREPLLGGLVLARRFALGYSCERLELMPTLSEAFGERGSHGNKEEIQNKVETQKNGRTNGEDDEGKSSEPAGISLVGRIWSKCVGKFGGHVRGKLVQSVALVDILRHFGQVWSTSGTCPVTVQRFANLMDRPTVFPTF